MDATETKLTAIMEPWVGKTGGLITALRSAQAAFGYLPTQTDAIAADIFNLTRAEVKGVISFYADFHREPKGRTVVRLCVAEACQAAGGRALQAAVEKRFAFNVGETSASRDLTLEPVYCLGLCSCAPAAMVGERLLGRADAGRIEAAVERESEAAE